MRPHAGRLHHTVTRTTITAGEIDAMHRQKGWSGIGYHYLIRQLWEGGPWTIERGRSEGDLGAHDAGENDTIGIAVAGDYSGGKPLPPMATDLLISLATDVSRRHRLSAESWRGHGGLDDPSDKTVCPGFDPRAVRAAIAARLAA